MSCDLQMRSPTILNGFNRFPMAKNPRKKQKKLGLNGNVYAKYRETQFWAPQVGFGIPNHVLAPPNEVPHGYEGF